MFRRDIFPYPREKDMPSTQWFCLTVFGDKTDAMFSHKQHVPGSCLCLKIWLLHWIILTFSYTTQYIILSPVWLRDHHSNELPSTPKPLKTTNRKSQATSGTTWFREDWNLLGTLSSTGEVKRLDFLRWLPKRYKRWSWKSQRLPETKHLWECLKPNRHFMD